VVCSVVHAQRTDGRGCMVGVAIPDRRVTVCVSSQISTFENFRVGCVYVCKSSSCVYDCLCVYLCICDRVFVCVCVCMCAYLCVPVFDKLRAYV
jgi:hypothetical protein